MYRSDGITIYPPITNNKKIDINLSKTNKCVDIEIGNNNDKFFKFIQNIPSNRWEIIHNLNKYPSVTVVDSGENVVIGDIEYINSNRLIIRFTSIFSGKAYLN